MESQIQVRKPLGFDAIIGAMSDQSVANDIILGVCTKDSSISRNPYEVCRNETRVTRVVCAGPLFQPGNRVLEKQVLELRCHGIIYLVAGWSERTRCGRAFLKCNEDTSGFM